METLLDPSNMHVISGNVVQSPKSKGLSGMFKSKTTTAPQLAITDSNITLNFAHPAPVFGCAWSEHERDVLATSCQDGMTRIFDCSMKGLAALKYVLKGHTARAFLPCWSPLLPGTIATGSDDASILLWEVNFDQLPSDAVAQKVVAPSKSLLGHRSNIRALSWNYENKSILLSGSWDASIRIWEVERGVCLSVLSAVPSRPTVYVYELLT